MRALIVTPAEARGALTAVRALGAGGWTVGVGSAGGRGVAASSRWAHKVHAVPPPEDDLDAFLAAVRRAVIEARYDVVFGSGDAEVVALSYGREALGARFPYPAHEVVLRSFDKVELARAVERVGLTSPPTAEWDPEERHGPDKPVLVKPRLHWTPDRRRGGARFETAVASGRAQIGACAAKIVDAGGDPIVQEIVSGPLCALALVTDGRGEVIAAVQQEASAIWPVRAGISVRATTVAIDPTLLERAAALLDDLGWSGLAHLQFIASVDGPVVVDLNGRFYGSLALAVAAGSNLPDIWARSATGGPLPPVRHAVPGVRYQWLEGDLRRAWVERRGGFLRDVVGCLRYSVGAAHSTWDPRDPRPAGHHAISLARRAMKKMRS